MNVPPPRSPRPAQPSLGRIAIAVLAAPAVVAALLSLGAFALAGMTEPSAEAVWRVTLQSALALSLLVFGFALTFGIAAVALLRALGRRGLLAWSLAGAAGGAAAGILFAAIGMDGFRAVVAVAFAVAGWGILVLIRALAGVRTTPGERSKGASCG